MKKKSFWVFLTVLMIINTITCTGKSNIEISNKKESHANSRTITDRSGRMLIINEPINRIVSTAPSNTEIIVDLGLTDKLIAVDRYSTNIKELPAAVIHIDFSYPDVEALLGLRPDIIIAHGHNTTVSGDDPFRLLKEMGIPVAYISMSKSINEIYLDIYFMADLLSVQDEGNALVSSMKAQVDELEKRTAQI